MPIYEYECKTCGHRFEELQNIHDASVKTCPECGRSVHRLPSTGVGVIFKGSGFYATDYGRSDHGLSTRCGREQTCCGRDERCDNPPCGD